MHCPCTALTVALAWLVCACVDWPQPPHPHAPSATRTTASQSAPDSLRLGSWNVRKLGFDAGKDLAAVARVVDRHFDLLALLELMWTEHGPLLEELLAELGPEWAGQITEGARPQPASQYSEYYAVLFRAARIAPCAEQPALRFVSQEAPSLNALTFLREPAVGCYRTDPALGGSDLLLAVYHARWGSGAVDEIAAEVAQVDTVFHSLHERWPGEQQLFMVGDFNLTPEQLAPLTAASDRTRGAGSTLGASGQPSAHLYDHLLAFGAGADLALEDDATVLDVRAEANDPASYRAHVSDHLPIMARLRLSADAD